MDSLNSENFNSLTGKVLISNPYCSFGEIFDKSLIYVAAHSSQGALGLIVNKSINSLSLKKLFSVNNDILPEVEKQIFVGGPIEPERSFILHSADYRKNVLFEPTSELLISSNTEIIKDILSGVGPKYYLITLGYTGWGMSQLESEIQRNYWLIDELEQEIIFSKDNNFKWQHSIEKLITNPKALMSQIGYS